MNTAEFSNILKQPETVNKHQTTELKELLVDFPYFQAAHALYLKGLHNQESHQYNQYLKRTAAYTADRSVLFEYITKTVFNQNIVSKTQQQLQQQANKAPVEITDETIVFNDDLFEEKTDTLRIGQPLEFNETEIHSFQEWLQLTKAKPIVRSEDSANEAAKPLGKVALIEQFINNKPKITPVKKTISVKNLASQKTFSSDEFMTETLAKVYLEQKNYTKAIQAYRILSLKYPEKNSFFADRISDIKQIEINNTNK